MFKSFQSNDLVVETRPIYKKRRYLLVFMAFCGLFNVYALRINLSVAIVAMTEDFEVTLENGTISSDRHFDWNSKEKGLVLSSFFYGYLFTQVIGGIWAAKYGGNLLFGIGIAVTALFTLLTPLAAKWSIYALVAVRVIEGLFEGVTYSSLFDMYSKWAPPLERTRMVTITYTGSYLGIVVSLPVSAWLSTIYGWESIFYFFGTIGLIWFALWVYLIKANPEVDPHISTEEKTYILYHLEKEGSTEKIPVPWKAIWTSSAVWAIIFAQFCEGWGFFTLQTELPTFLKDALNFDIKKSGIISALPYLCMVIMLHVAGHLADYIQINGWWTTQEVRRYFNSIAFAAQMICMLLAAFLLHPTTSVVFITIGVALAAFAYSSFCVNYLDIAPNFAGIIMGICNSFSTVAGIISPLLTGFIVQNKSAEEWKTVFYISAGFYLIGGVVYCIWVQGTVQHWAVAPLKLSEHTNNSSEQPECTYKNEAFDAK